MYNYVYVAKKEWKPIKKELIELINQVQDIVRNKFTFQFVFTGSSSRNMITCDHSQNKGFDFDVDIYVNDKKNKFSPKEIKETLINAFNKVVLYYGYDNAENSTKVITIKDKDHINNKILKSCDFCIVNDYEENGCTYQKYIHYNKKQNSYSWCDNNMPMFIINDKAEELKKENYWNIVKDAYLDKKTITLTKIKNQYLCIKKR